jgi:hypothetical protein
MRLKTASALPVKLVLVSTLAGCCLFPGIPEALRFYDFQTDPDGDGTLATARPVVWSGDTAVVAGGIAFDPANIALIRSYLGQETIGNNMPPPDEADVFNLGTLEPNDRISVSVCSLVETLVDLVPAAPTALVENGSSKLVFLVDSHSEIVGYPAASPIAIDRAGDYYLVVESPVPADYKLTIRRSRNSPPVPPRRGVLLLLFGIDPNTDMTLLADMSSVVPVEELGPFNWDEFRPDLPGQDERFRQAMRQVVAYIYADYDVLVTLDPQEARTTGQLDAFIFAMRAPDSTDALAGVLGQDPTVDAENQLGQIGIAYVLSDNTTRYADFDTLCAVWGVVAAHEYGHSVGLWHVANESDDLMAPDINLETNGTILKRPGTAEMFTPTGSRSTTLPLIQNADRYLSRVLGRRDPNTAAEIRRRTAEMLGIKVND